MMCGALHILKSNEGIFPSKWWVLGLKTKKKSPSLTVTYSETWLASFPLHVSQAKKLMRMKADEKDNILGPCGEFLRWVEPFYDAEYHPDLPRPHTQPPSSFLVCDYICSTCFSKLCSPPRPYSGSASSHTHTLTGQSSLILPCR